MSTTLSSPDPLTDAESIASSPRRRSPYPHSRALTPVSPARKSVLLRGHSPAKQTFELDVGDAISPKRIRVTVEAEPEHHQHAPQRPSSSDSGGRLSPSPYYSTPFRRSAMKVRTTTVPLRGLSDSEEDAPIATPKRGRGRPRKSIGTPIPAKAKRTLTPAAGAKNLTKTRRLSDLLGGSSGDNSEEWDFNVPQNLTINRGRSESHSRVATAAPYSAIPAEFERASSEVPMSSRANKHGRRNPMQDGTPSAFGNSFRKARIGQSRLGRLDYDIQPRRSEELRRSSESIVEPEAEPDVGFGPFSSSGKQDSSRPSTAGGENGRGLGSSPPSVGGQVAYPALTPLRRDANERQQSVGYQEFSFAQHDGEDYGQSSSIASTGALPSQAKQAYPIRSDSSEQHSEHQPEQAQNQTPYTATQQLSPLRTDSPEQHSGQQWEHDQAQNTYSATKQPSPQREDSPPQQYYDQDSHSTSPAPSPQRGDPPPQQYYDQDSHSTSPAPSPQREDSPPQQYYGQDSHSTLPAPSRHHQSSPHPRHSADLPFPSLSPAPQQDRSGSHNSQPHDHDEGDHNAFDEFDTIMENEDFTMITADTVPSLLQYFTSPLNPVEQAEVRAEIAAEEVALGESERKEDEVARRRMQASGFQDIVHVLQTVERSVSRGVEADVRVKVDSTAVQEESLELIQEAQPVLPKSSPIKASGKSYFPSPSPPIRVSGRGYVPSPTPVYQGYQMGPEGMQQPLQDNEEQNPVDAGEEFEEMQEQNEEEMASKSPLIGATGREYVASLTPPVEVAATRSSPIRATGRGYVPSPTPPAQPENEWVVMNDQKSESSDYDIEPRHEQEEMDEEAEGGREQSVFSDATERNTPLPEVAQSPRESAIVEEQDALSNGEEENQDSHHSNATIGSLQHANGPENEDVVDADPPLQVEEEHPQLRSSALLTPDETPSHSNMGAEEEMEEEDVDIWELEAETYNQSRVAGEGILASEQEESSQAVRERTLEPRTEHVVEDREVVPQPVHTENKTLDEVEGEADQDVWMAEATVDPDPEPEPEPAPEPPTPGFKRSLQRSQVEIELEEVLQKAQKRRSGLPYDLMRQSRGSAFGNSVRGDTYAFDQTQTQIQSHSLLGLATDGAAEERPSMLGDASMIRRERRQREADESKKAEEREAERIRILAASKEAERQKRREEREMERRKRAEELEAELQREREEREAKREAERQKRREERERARDEEINKDREERYRQKQRDEELQRQKEEKERRMGEERREREAQRQSELEAEREAERLMVEAKRAAEREEERVAELRKEREAAKQRRREERQAERDAEMKKEAEERAAQHQADKQKNRDKENFQVEEQHAAKRRMLEPTALRVERSQEQGPEMGQVKQRERLPFGSVPATARRLDTKVFVGNRETQSTSYIFEPLKVAQKENDPFRMSGYQKRTFEPREVLAEKPHESILKERPDFLFDPPSRYAALAPAVDAFAFAPPTQANMKPSKVSDTLSVRGGMVGSLNDVCARPELASIDKEPVIDEVEERQPEPLRRVMKSVEIAPPFSDGLYDEDMEQDDNEQENEADAFSDAEKSASVSVERSQSRSVSRSVSKEQSESRSVSRSVSRSPSRTPTAGEFELTGALYADEREISRSPSTESSSQQSSSEDDVDAEMEDAPSQSASLSTSIEFHESESQCQSKDEREEEEESADDEQDQGEDQEMGDEGEDPFSRFSDSENEIVASTPMPPRGLKPILRQRKRFSHRQSQPTSPQRPHLRRGRQASESEEDEEHEQDENEGKQCEMEEQKERQGRRSTSSNPYSSFRPPQSPLKSSFKKAPPPGSPKKAVIFSATTAISPDSSMEEVGETMATGTEAEQDLLGRLAQKDDVREESESRSPDSPTPSFDDLEDEELEEEVEDRSHLRKMTPYDWSKSHWKSLLAIKNIYESGHGDREIPRWVKESAFVDETIWGGEEDGSMDLVVEAWMVDVARLFILEQKSQPVLDADGGYEGEDWSQEMEHVIKRVYGLVSVERKCKRQGKKAPWEVVAQKFQPVKKRTVERLDSKGEWVEVKDRKGFFGLGMGWL